MSDASVVAIVPVAGRAEWYLDAVDRIVEVPESDLIVSAVDVAAQPGVRVVLVHDPRRSAVPSDVVARVVESVVVSGRPVVPVLPCSDTVKQLDESGVVIDTPDRSDLRVIQSPIGYPARLLAAGTVVPGTVPSGALFIDGGVR